MCVHDLAWPSIARTRQDSISARLPARLVQAKISLTQRIWKTGQLEVVGVYAAFPRRLLSSRRSSYAGRIGRSANASPYFTARYFVRRASCESTPHMVSREISFDCDIARRPYFFPKWACYAIEEISGRKIEFTAGRRRNFSSSWEIRQWEFSTSSSSMIDTYMHIHSSFSSLSLSFSKRFTNFPTRKKIIL